MEALLPLALLACPVGMGLMMWFMMRGSKDKSTQPGGDRSRSVESLRREQARLAAEIDRASSQEQTQSPTASPR